jgi:hypothetical protein
MHRRPAVSRSLLWNSRAALLAAVEIHNKPVFPYRYEVCTLLVINGWELLLKAYIKRYLPRVKIVQKNGTSKPFLECVGCIAATLGNGFEVIRHNLELLYEYRNHIAHFFPEDIDPLLFALLRKSVALYINFLANEFDIPLSVENLVLLPIGLGGPPVSPLDFMTKKSQEAEASPEARRLIASVMRSTEELSGKGIDECVFVPVTISLVNENRVKNADVVAAINNSQPQGNTIAVYNFVSSGHIVEDPDARTVHIEEESLFKNVYTETYQDVIENGAALFADFVRNSQFNHIMADIKQNPTLHRRRYLNVQNLRGSYKDYYSKAVYSELAKHYKAKQRENSPQPGVANPKAEIPRIQ